jgi:hypothetical protein
MERLMSTAFRSKSTPRKSGSFFSKTNLAAFSVLPAHTLTRVQDSSHPQVELEADLRDKKMHSLGQENLSVPFFDPLVATRQRKGDHCQRKTKQLQRKAVNLQLQSEPSDEKPLVSDAALLACLLLSPLPLKPFCFSETVEQKGGRSGGGGASGSWTPAPAPGITPPAPPPPVPTSEMFFHGSTWRIAQSIPGNVKAIGGGDFGQGFYTHHDLDTSRAEDRARWEGCRLCQKMSPAERYAGVISFEVPTTAYRSLFTSRKSFGLTSTWQKDYAAKQKAWLNFVSGRGRGREAEPSFDPAHMSWRHLRVDPPPGQDYFLMEGPMYKGVEGLPGTSVPPRSSFDPYAEGTALPQQIVWNYQKAMDVLNASKTTLKPFDASKECAPVDPPVSMPLLNQSTMEDPTALEAAQIELTGF